MSEQLNGKRILVTGADGFIGSHLIELLADYEPKEIRAYIYYNSWNQIGWLQDIAQETRTKITIIPGDIRDAERVRQAVKGSDYVFHLSSLIAIPYSYVAVRSYVDTNVLGAINILEACRESENLKQLVHVSTSEVYGTAQTVPISEDHPLVGQSPYSASKIAADKMVESYYLSFNLPVVIARPFNTYGPRQTARAVIPTIAAQLLKGCSELKLGALTPTRDFNYVKDTARGMIALAVCDTVQGQVINIGSGQEWSIEKTAKLLMDITDHQIPIICDEERLRPEKSEVNRLIADNQKITQLTDWHSETTFEQGLTQTVKWMRDNLQYFHNDGYTI